MKSIPRSDGVLSAVRKLWRSGLWAALGTLTALAGEPRTVVLQRLTDAPKFDGWGTSLCWYANAIGRWPEPQRSEIADALFSTRGLGLTVVRYNIGGGEAPDHHHMPWFRQMEGFEPAAGQWNWDADPGQRWMLAAAVQRGANRLEAFSNSPPYWMTVSRCASGAVKATDDNLDPRQETAFAEYLAAVVTHFRTAWGISFDTLDPFNEPYTDYWKANHNQEGCHFDHASQARMLQRLRAVLDQHGLQSVQISASDETNYDKAIETWKSFDAPTRACVAQVNAHAYATEHRTELRDLIRQSDKPLVMSEVDDGGGAGHDHDGMVPALDLARRISDDLRDLQPLRWVVWQAVEDEGGAAQGNHNWGLIHADLVGDHHTWALTKKYHAMAQFSKFIRPGAVLLPCADADSVAAYDAGRHVLVIVTRNAQPADVPTVYDLSAFGKGTMPVVAYRTSATESVTPLTIEPAVAGRFSAMARAQSITTYVVTLRADPAQNR